MMKRPGPPEEMPRVNRVNLFYPAPSTLPPAINRFPASVSRTIEGAIKLIPNLVDFGHRNHALNIEPDDQSDDEIDNTREIQIEDAVKQYQIALKLHSQGPSAYPQAAEAYSNLFKSEIFKYPESVTEFTRLDEHPDLEYADAAFPHELVLVAGGGEGPPSTLPQILYLSYKNHGQFILDCVKYRFAIQNPPAEEATLDHESTFALHNFAHALASDESDTELWRRVARIGALLGSRRIARYCLEAAVEVDDDPTVAEVDPPSLEEGFAGEQLKEQLEVLSDEVALSHPIMGPFIKKSIPVFLTKYMDPYPFLPKQRGLVAQIPNVEDAENRKPRTVIEVPERSWAALGQQLCVALVSPHGLSGTGAIIRLPQASGEQVSDGNNMLNPQPVEDQIMQDIRTTESPAPESEAIPTPATVTPQNLAVAVLSNSTTVPLLNEPAEQSVTLPTRKRSQSAAGFRDTPEDENGTQKRSKRIRNRDNTLPEGAVDPATQFAEELQACVRADEDVFTFAGGILKKIGVEDLGALTDLQTALANEGSCNREEAHANTAARDLRDLLRSWDDNKGLTYVNSNAEDVLGSSVGNANAGLASFLEHWKSGPLQLSNKPLFDVRDGLDDFEKKKRLWPDDLKGTVVRVISFLDAEIFDRIKTDMDRISFHEGNCEKLSELEGLVQNLFELHLDIYSRITNPNSIVHYETRVMTKERVDRWHGFSADVMRSRRSDLIDELSLRYMWASVFYATMAEGVTREHKVLCWSDLQEVLFNQGNPLVELQNNAVMPEISVSAAEQEVSRLTTMDFFHNLFQPERSDPLAIIETLEPVLDPESACQSTAAEIEDSVISLEAADNTPAALRDMWKFLKSGSISLRLFLWQRLREAYFSIDYNTKVFSCHLKCLEIIVADLRTDDYIDSSEEPRRHKLLVWVKALDDLLVKALTIALNDSATCFEVIDERHIKSTCAALAQLSRILYSAATFDDEVRVGMTPLAQTPAYGPNGSFSGFSTKIREMQVRTWALLYTMIKESMSQNPELFPAADNDLADFLAIVHYSLGLRKYCKSSNKIFLKMMKIEMLRLKQVDRWEDYVGQVLFDLYGVRLGLGTYMLEDHGCPIEALDRRTAMNIAEQVIALANKMPLKDLMKHELRTTIEKMQQAIGPAKITPQMQHNLRNYTEYLKTSIRPLYMYQALRGQFEVDSIPVTNQDSALAGNGWYFLLGMISLTKFRSQKRLGPGAQTDDLRVGATFMRLQLQYTADHWETWYRLAQCFDYELEEEVMWSADKVNNHRPELVTLQRSSIHCYVMALSTAIRKADDSVETANRLSEMYHDFGMRCYASSREPFGMEAFWVDDFEKHMSGAAGMYKKSLHEEMSRYKVWKYAAALFRRSLKDRPNYWMNHFMLGKCLWKMFHNGADEWDMKDKVNLPSVYSILDCFVSAIQTVPKPKDSRQEPVLEPHYKLVSIAHKMVELGVLHMQDAANLLQEQPHALRKGEAFPISNLEEWQAFVLETLRSLRNSDKQHWHHRMVARVANILFDETKPDYIQACAARDEFRESIFTKTMQIQVWKPDAERPGRHCVFMERYVRFMVKLLSATNDKDNMEMLTKRVKKKGSDFFHFNQVWTECCSSYLRLIRRHGDIPAGLEDVFKSILHDEFETFSDRLHEWIGNPNLDNPALTALREAIELKSLNKNQMKSAPIDDLINDAWAYLYNGVAKSLPGPYPGSLQQSQMDGDAGRSTGTMSINLVMNLDGTTTPTTMPFQGAEPPRPRKIGVSRREVIRRAELAVNRGTESVQPRTTAPSRPRVSVPPTVLGSTRTPHTSKCYCEGGTELKSTKCADDESDLSDVPDMDEGNIFPNLVRVGGSSGDVSARDEA
ncbi:hypothetical protein B7494_g5637 [Chlorociboria aeruginascens]|nr:hypothetical protein B7494_g5637 [Chlorociboria aeruginascens]